MLSSPATKLSCAPSLEGKSVRKSSSTTVVVVGTSAASPPEWLDGAYAARTAGEESTANAVTAAENDVRGFMAETYVGTRGDVHGRESLTTHWRTVG